MSSLGWAAAFRPRVSRCHWPVEKTLWEALAFPKGRRLERGPVPAPSCMRCPLQCRAYPRVRSDVKGARMARN